MKQIISGELPPNDNLTPLEHLLKVMNDNSADPRARMNAAIAAAKYIHEKPRATRTLKKEQRHQAADEAYQGLFKSGPMPIKH